MGKVACGIVGVGGIGANHGKWMEATGVMQVRAVCDTNAALSDLVGEKFPHATFYTDIEKMLAAEKLDLTVIASPHHQHKTLTIACLEGGSDVLVEKPMATKYVDCVAMIEAAKKCGRLLTVFHNRRLDPSFVAVRDALASGRLGALVEARATWQNAPAWKKTHKTWRAYRESSGGLMYDWGAHLIDHVLHFAHSSVASVAASLWCRAGADPLLNQDHGQIDIRFASGVVGRIVVSDIDREPRNRYMVIGEDATLVDGWNFGPGAMKIFTGDALGELAVEEIHYESDKGSGAGFYANLAAHYRDGVPAMVTAESAARVIRVLNAADESQARGGSTVGFDE